MYRNSRLHTPSDLKNTTSENSVLGVERLAQNFKNLTPAATKKTLNSTKKFIKIAFKFFIFNFVANCP